MVCELQFCFKCWCFRKRRNKKRRNWGTGKPTWSPLQLLGNGVPVLRPVLLNELPKLLVLTGPPVTPRTRRLWPGVRPSRRGRRRRRRHISPVEEWPWNNGASGYIEIFTFPYDTFGALIISWSKDKLSKTPDESLNVVRSMAMYM